MQFKTLALILKQPSAMVAIALTVFASMSIGVAVFLYIQDREYVEINAAHNVLLSQANQVFNARVGDIENSTRLINSYFEYALEREAPHETEAPVDKEGAFYRANSESAANALATIGLTLPSISQIRWIDKTGDETLRINFREGVASIVPSNQLQNKSARYFVKDAFNSPPNVVSLSDIDLNVERGKIEVPYVPTVRSIINFKDHPSGEGLFVVNFQLTDMLKELRALSSTQHHLLISKDSGSWLLHTDKSMEWGVELETGSLAMDSAPVLWDALDNELSVSLVKGSNDDIYSARRITHGTKDKFSDESLIFFARTNRDFYEQAFYNSLALAIFLSVLSASVSIFFLLRDKFREMQLGLLAHRLEEEKLALSKALEEQTILQDELLESEKMASLGMLVSGMAHELNTPIGGALMMVSSIQRRVDELESLIPDKLTLENLHGLIKHNKEACELALSNLNRSADLIKRFKRVSVDRGSEDIVQFSLEKLITDLSLSIKPLLKGKKVEVLLDADSDIMLTSYSGVLSQVLQNLVVNSIEHAFQNQQNNTIVLAFHREGDNVIIMHKDNGVGISEDIRPNMFDPFVTSARASGNTGLGLHLIYQWVTGMLQGKIDVDSREGETTFTITMPIVLEVNDEKA
ncbi:MULTISPECIES: sensor histidine kinase [unclassified Alteromonas]|uniref:sensor histidine kinase n=1 Tax=unclassified Alteromonas TaxID=2614992 RepID=UPI000509F1C2|nr:MULTISPECIES: HAMP domain-containing sensor histidine kinase [unclassified Alteromonas]